MDEQYIYLEGMQGVELRVNAGFDYGAATEKEINADNINFINAKGVIDNLFYVGMRHITETKVGKLNESL